MKTLTLNIPDDLEITNNEAALLLASKLYEQGKLSIGQAAQVTGYSKRTFIELLGNNDVSLFSTDEEELKNDLLNATRYNR